MSSIRCHCVFFTQAFLAFGCAGASDANDAGTGGMGTAGAGGTSTAGASGTSTAGASGTSAAGTGGTVGVGGAKGGTAGTNDGVPTQAGSGGASGAAGNIAAAGTISGGAGAAGGPSASFEVACLADAADACERCLCSECSEPLEACANTAGCPEIAACIRQSQCRGVDCYCGSADALTCASGLGNGPCKAAILEAPGGREPSLLNPSAGPASDAAVAISTCAEEGQPCAEACSSE
jgi:hypothetical protein